jgi:hypothetical protein
MADGQRFLVSVRLGHAGSSPIVIQTAAER